MITELGQLLVHIFNPDECWNYRNKPYNTGYGMFSFNGKRRTAHRVTYQLMRGPIPESMQLDHLCRNRLCVNPFHLEIVTSQENLLRGDTLAAKNAAKTVCLRGHLLSGPNLYLYENKHTGKLRRECKECRRKSISHYQEKSHR